MLHLRSPCGACWASDSVWSTLHPFTHGDLKGTACGNDLVFLPQVGRLRPEEAASHKALFWLWVDRWLGLDPQLVAAAILCSRVTYCIELCPDYRGWCSPAAVALQGCYQRVWLGNPERIHSAATIHQRKLELHTHTPRTSCHSRLDQVNQDCVSVLGILAPPPSPITANKGFRGVYPTIIYPYRVVMNAVHGKASAR